MSQRLPPIAYVLGLGGVIPFAACGIAACSPAAQQALGLAALLAYAAVILSFLGAVQWGFALAPVPPTAMPGAPAMSVRLTLGVLPALIGWAAVLLSLAGFSELGLALLILGFAGTVMSEARWARFGLLPTGYMTLRWILSIVVVVTLVTVLVLRLVGASIVF